MYFKRKGIRKSLFVFGIRYHEVRVKWGVADAIAALPMSSSRYSKFWHGAAGGGRGKLINAVEYARDI